MPICLSKTKFPKFCVAIAFPNFHVLWRMFGFCSQCVLFCGCSYPGVVSFAWSIYLWLNTSVHYSSLSWQEPKYQKVYPALFHCFELNSPSLSISPSKNVWDGPYFKRVFLKYGSLMPSKKKKIWIIDCWDEQLNWALWGRGEIEWWW